MTSVTKAGFTAATFALAVALAGCGSDRGDTAATSSETTAESSTSAPVETTSVAPETGAAADGPNVTVADYLQEIGVTQTLVFRGDPGAPTLNLPIPAGWADVGADTPADAYGAIYLTSAADPSNPPAIIARMARLSGEVDQAKILELAPNAVRNQPGYAGPETGQPSELGGFEASEIAGTVLQDGQPAFVARKTVVISGQDAVYLVALDAQGPTDQQPVLMDAMAVIDAETTIEP